MITRQPTNQMIVALQDVTFTCTAKGYEVNYEWRHHKNNSIIGRGSTYTISKATPLVDEDQYYCVAMTKGGYAFSHNVTLRVNGESLNIFCELCLVCLLLTYCLQVFSTCDILMKTHDVE